MTRKFPLLAVLGMAALVGVLAYGGVVLAQASPATDTMTFTLTVDETAATFGPAGLGDEPEPGQQVTEAAPVARDGETVGRLATTFAIISVESDGFTALLDSSVELPEGNLVVNGSFHSAALTDGSALAVIGGTGDYAGATGTVMVTRSPDGTSSTLEFDIHQV